MGGGERAEISHHVEFVDGGGDGWTEGDSLSVPCLAASQLSILMEIPSMIAAAQTVCRRYSDVRLFLNAD